MSGIPMVNVEMVTSPSQVAPSQVQPNASNLSAGTITTAAGTTPLTPEILNSVMAMTNPLEYSFPADNASSAGPMFTTKVSQVLFLHSDGLTGLCFICF